MTVRNFLKKQEGRDLFEVSILIFGLVRTDKPKISRQTLHSKIRYYLDVPMKKEERDKISSIILPAYVEYKKFRAEIDRIVEDYSKV